MRIFLLAFFFLPAWQLSAQSIQHEINVEVWKPFLKASNEFDGALFMSVQSKDLVQASLESGRVIGYKEYEEGILPNFERIRKEGKIKRTTEMRFTHRIATETLAHERGIFKSTTWRANGEIRIRYAAFYMTLRKEEGRWKILVDSDSSLNGTITEEMFLTALPLE